MLTPGRQNRATVPSILAYQLPSCKTVRQSGHYSVCLSSFYVQLLCTNTIRSHHHSRQLNHAGNVQQRPTLKTQSTRHYLQAGPKRRPPCIAHMFKTPPLFYRFWHTYRVYCCELHSYQLNKNKAFLIYILRVCHSGKRRHTDVSEAKTEGKIKK